MAIEKGQSSRNLNARVSGYDLFVFPQFYVALSLFVSVVLSCRFSCCVIFVSVGLFHRFAKYLLSAHIILAAYLGMDWDGNVKQQARDERFVAKAHTFSCSVSLFFGGGAIKLASSQAYPRPLSCLSRPAAVGSPHLSSTSAVFGPSCMRQKFVPRTVWRPSPTPAIMVHLRSTNTNKIQFTQRLPLGPELHMGKERCCLRGLDHLHGPTSHSICGKFFIYKPSSTSERFMFEHDESLRAALLPRNFPASYENGKLEDFFASVDEESRT